VRIDFQIDKLPSITFEHPAEKVAFEKWVEGSLHVGGSSISLSYGRRTGTSKIGPTHKTEIIELETE